MADLLSSDDFAPRVGQRFELVPPAGEPVELALSSCDVGEPPAAGGRTPFSLTFHASPDRVVPQQICTLRHPELGDLALFVVPIGPDARGMRYEIVFA